MIFVAATRTEFIRSLFDIFAAHNARGCFVCPSHVIVSGRARLIAELLFSGFRNATAFWYMNHFITMKATVG
jgi:hypothetical protein